MGEECFLRCFLVLVGLFLMWCGPTLWRGCSGLIVNARSTMAAAETVKGRKVTMRKHLVENVWIWFV